MSSKVAIEMMDQWSIFDIGYIFVNLTKCGGFPTPRLIPPAKIAQIPHVRRIVQYKFPVQFGNVLKMGSTNFGDFSTASLESDRYILKTSNIYRLIPGRKTP